MSTPRHGPDDDAEGIAPIVDRITSRLTAPSASPRTLREARADALRANLDRREGRALILDGQAYKSMRRDHGWGRAEVNLAVDDLLGRGEVYIDRIIGRILVRRPS